MSAVLPCTIPPFRQSRIEIAHDLSISDLAIWSGLSRNTLLLRIHDVVDPLPAFQMGRKLLVAKSDYLAWRARRSTTAPDPAILPPRRRRRKSRAS